MKDSLLCGMLPFSHQKGHVDTHCLKSAECIQRKWPYQHEKKDYKQKQFLKIVPTLDSTLTHTQTFPPPSLFVFIFFSYSNADSVMLTAINLCQTRPSASNTGHMFSHRYSSALTRVCPSCFNSPVACVPYQRALTQKKIYICYWVPSKLHHL